MGHSLLILASEPTLLTTMLLTFAYLTSSEAHMQIRKLKYSKGYAKTQKYSNSNINHPYPC